MSNDSRGRFVWHELLTTDTKAAGAFYSKVTGWKTQAWDKDPSYTLWVTGKGPFGGVRTLPDAARATGSRWLPYVGTPDVDATVQAAQRLGARVTTGATDIPDAGRFAVLADPQGAAFAIYGPPAGAPPQPDSGSSGSEAFSWHELTTSDAVAALGFYSELFGWKELRQHDMGPMGIYHLVGIQGVESIGMFKATADRPMPTQWMCYAHVADVDKAANAAKAAGGKLVNGPMEVPGGTWIAHLVDPQGAVFSVHADKRVVAATPAAQPAKPAAPKSPSAAPQAKPTPPTLSAPASVSAPSPKPKAAPTLSPTASVPAASSKPAAAKAPPAAKPAAPKAPAKAAANKVAKPATKKVAKKAAKKKAPVKKAPKKKAAAKKRPARKSKSAAKKATRKSSAKRKSAKKRAKKSTRRRAKAGGFAAARRLVVKQADSLLKRLRGKKRR